MQNVDQQPYHKHETMEGLSLKDLLEEAKDIRKELHVYTKVIPMTAAVREDVRSLIDRLANCYRIIGRVEQSLDRQENV